MYNNKKILAIIPARGGSKRLPNKNILDLVGKPLIAWTIEAAKKSKYITDFIVSTDDTEIADVSKKYGALVPFLRPKELSEDTSSSVDVLIHALNFFKNELLKEYDYIILLQPTSPIRDYEDIDSAIELLFEKNADSIVSVCECEHSPLWTNTLPSDFSMNKFINSDNAIRSQDLPTYYRLNGAIYIVNVQRILEEKKFTFNSNSYAYIMSQLKSVDIDTELDLKIAEVIIK